MRRFLHSLALLAIALLSMQPALASIPCGSLGHPCTSLAHCCEHGRHTAGMTTNMAMDMAMDMSAEMGTDNNCPQTARVGCGCECHLGEWRTSVAQVPDEVQPSTATAHLIEPAPLFNINVDAARCQFPPGTWQSASTDRTILFQVFRI